MANRHVERVEIFVGDSGEWTFHRVAANNEIISDGETYPDYDNALTSAIRNYGEQLNGEPLPYFKNDGNEWEEIPAETITRFAIENQ